MVKSILFSHLASSVFNSQVPAKWLLGANKSFSERFIKLTRTRRW